MLFRIDHETRFTYTAPITEAVSEVRIAPPSQDDQTVLGYRLRVTPSAPVTAYRDGFGNKVELFNVLVPHSELVVASTACVRVDRQFPAALGTVPFSAELSQHVDAVEFLRSSPQVDFAGPVRDFAATVSIWEGASVRTVAEHIMAGVRERLQYEKRVTAAHTRVSEAFELRRGVCQDFAHLFLAVARLRGLAARYVSGYIHQPGEIATHAWVQVWGGAEVGWVNIDPTHDRWVESDHVVIAVGRDFSDVPPNRGVWKGEASETITVTVNVRPVDRVPTELTESSSGAWSATSGRSATGSPERQGRVREFRQQQSQQQQSWS